MSRPSALGLDFVARRRSANLAGWLLLLAGVALTGLALLDGQTASDEAAGWVAKTEHWQSLAKHSGRGSREAVDGDAAALRPQVEAATKAIARLGTPWGDLYRSLEASLDDSVSLLAILPNVEKGEVRLNGEAKDFAALRGYLQRLGASGALTDVRLLGQEVKQSDAQHPIAFAIVATWRRAS
jgi:Tfp pilus assembly protein PilN